jgi:hypothetical protein
MRLLLIAPELKSDVIRSQQEALMRDIQSSELQATFLQGTVTRSDVIRELRSGRYDVLMAMTHGYAQGIQLSPGAWLEPQHLGTLARFGVSLVVLLACESNVAGQVVMNSAQVDTICHIAPLDSEDAYLVGSLLVQGLANGLTYREAYERAKPGGSNTDFLYLAAATPQVAKVTMNESERWLGDHDRRIAEHGKRLDAHDIEITLLKRDGRFELRKTDVFFWAVLAVGVGGLLFALMGNVK